MIEFTHESNAISTAKINVFVCVMLIVINVKQNDNIANISNISIILPFRLHQSIEVKAHIFDRNVCLLIKMC